MYVADLFKVGSTSYRALLALWIATTILLLGLLYPFGINTASAADLGDLEKRSQEYNTVNYANVVWTSLETRITSSSKRPCAAEANCADIVVVEALITNLDDSVAVIDVADVNLKIFEDVFVPLRRFDCGARVNDVALESEIINAPVKCLDSGTRFTLSSNESVASSMLFEVVGANTPRSTSLSIQIQEAHRSTAKPALLNLGPVIKQNLFPLAGALSSSSTVELEESSRTLTLIESSFGYNYGNDRAEIDSGFYIFSLRPLGLSDLEEARLIRSTDWTLEVNGQKITADRVIKTSDAGSQFDVVFTTDLLEGVSKLKFESEIFEANFKTVFRIN